MASQMSRAQIMEWRRKERARLIEARRAIPPRERHDHAAQIADHLADLLADATGRVISFYWPIRAEPNLLPLMARLEERGNRCALPVVIRLGEPLIFRSWRDGEPLVPGIWNIPTPAEGELVIPDIAIAPVIGFDGGSYRLGYGGGFYDRTLASLAKRPQAIGVGYALAAIPTIHPLPHDIPMARIVTEQGIVGPRSGG